MKKLSLLFVFALITNFAFTQTIPNGDLENWDSLHSATTTAYWWQPSYVGINWLGTLNSLAGLPASTGGPGPITVERTTDAYSGTYAAKLVSHPMNLGAITIFIPGMLGTAVMDMIGVRAIIGNPCAGCKPLHFKGYYKFEPAGEDSCAVVAIVSKWNSETHKRDTIAYGKMVQHSAVSTYTPFDIELTYGLSGVPDSLSYLMVSSAGFNVINFMGSQGNDGSTMYVDEVSLEYPAGIEQSLMPDVGVKVYPNPATEQITVELSDKVENGRLEVYTTDGKSIATYKLKEVNTTIPVKGLSAGTYYFKLMERNHLLNTGTFLIVK
jgi:hypothetical protein